MTTADVPDDLDQDLLAPSDPVADPDSRADPQRDLKGVLHRYLGVQRQALLWKLDGLDERRARWPHTATGTNLLGLAKHVAHVESGYFGEVFGRPFPESLPALADDAEPNADMWATADESVDDVRQLCARVFAHSDATIEALPIDATGRVPWWGPQGDGVTLGLILVHVISDVARHAGHADILREQTDGAAGLRTDNDNLPTDDEAWWSDYVERLRTVADTASVAANVKDSLTFRDTDVGGA